MSISSGSRRPKKDRTAMMNVETQRAGSVMGSLVATVANHVSNLSGEVAEKPSSKNAQSKQPKPRTAFPFAVVGSSNPSLDLSTILWLFPQKFKSETAQDGFILTERDIRNGRLLMIIDSKASNQHSGPVHWKNMTFICAEREIVMAAERCRGKAATVFLREIIQVATNKSATLCVIRLSGGGNLVLVSRVLLKTVVGRNAFADFVVSRERIEAMERKSSQREDEGEDLLKSLEEEFDEHRNNRRASANKRQSMTNNNGGLSSSDLGGLEDNLDDADECCSLDGYAARHFPTLALSLQRKHGFMQRDVPINSQSPITFETDLFAGKINILMRPQVAEDSPFFFEQVGSDTPVRFVLQIQGKFKYNPQGTVYAGFELVDEPQSSLVAQTWCSVLLKKMRDKYPSCHCSFGDDGEKAHMVAPAWTFFDRLVVSRGDTAIPPINELFHEPQGSVDARQASRSRGAWLSNQTYSFTSYTEFIDFPSWSLVNLGADRHLDMHTLFGESALKLVLYEHRDATVAPEQHLQAYNHYLFSLQLQYRSTTDDLFKSEEEETVRVSETIPESTEESDTDREDDIVEDDIIDDGELDVITAPQLLLPSKEILEITNAACPAWVEVIEDEPGKYQKYYAFTVDNESVVFRKPGAFKTFLDFTEAAKQVKDCSGPRVAASEINRRILGYAFTKGLEKNFAKTKRLTSRKSNVDTQFLTQRGQLEPVEPDTNQDVLKTCFVARALSERHWREEYVRLFEDRIDFYHPLRSKPHFSIYGTTVIKTTTLEEVESPHFPGYFVLEVEILGRSLYLMYSSAKQRDKWDAIFDEFSQNNKDAFTGELLDGIESPMKEFSHLSSMWDCQQRRILNSRRFKFSVPTVNLDPTTIVEKALLRVSLVQEDPYDKSLVSSFLDTVALLKDADIYFLDAKERLAFFLNLFNLLTMHAQLILGLPYSADDKSSMLQMASYQVSDDIFSLAELEHCILRASMSYPSQGGHDIPKSRYDFFIQESDYRINFCLDSRHPVPIFKAPILDLQLDSIALLALERAHIDKSRGCAGGGITATLPNIMWNYRHDFGSTVMEALTKIDTFLSPKCRLELQNFRQIKGRKRVTVKYIPAASDGSGAQGRMMRLENKARSNNDSLELIESEKYGSHRSLASFGSSRLESKSSGTYSSSS